jgi:multicomponent Na+:H+ antiporter subunit D
MTTHLLLLPILIPLAGAPVALLLARWRRVQGGWTLGTMLTSLVASAWLLWEVWQGDGPLVFASGGWTLPFGIALVADLLAVLLVAMTQIVLVAGILYALGARDQAITYPAFYPLFLTLGTGLTGAFLTGDLFNLFVFSELLVISGAALTAISDDRYGPEAAYKYFYMSLLAATSLLLAVGSLYISYGTLNMADLAQRIAADPSPPLVPFAIAFLTAAFMAKSAVFPFHFWQPDFHTASPTPVSAMLSSVVVKLGVYGFLRMTTLLFLHEAETLRLLLMVLGVVGILYGGLAALGTHNAKRMLAYSTLAQIGFILVGIGWGTPLALAAALVFTVNHSVIKAAMLMLAGSVASRTKAKSAAFSVVTGLGRQMPAAGLLFFAGGLALAGIPPTNGFVSKLLLFNSGIEAEQWLVLAVIGVASILTLVYTMRAFQRIWWHAPDPAVGTKPAGDRLAAPLLLVLLIVALGIWAQPLVQLAADTSAWLLEPTGYIQAVLGG